jgi:hypothetical protein
VGARVLIAGRGALIARVKNAESPTFDRDLIELKSNCWGFSAKWRTAQKIYPARSLFRDGGSTSNTWIQLLLE